MNESDKPITSREELERIVDGMYHLELYTSARYSNDIGVPCWCALRRNHSYAEWVAAGRPDTRSKLVSRRRTRRVSVEQPA